MTPLTRKLTGWHDLFMHLVLILGFLAVVTSYTTPLWLLISFPVGMVAAYFVHRAGLAKPSHNRWYNILIVLVAIALFVEYLYNPLIDVMVFGIQFVLVLILIKLFSRQGARDELQIYALSFLIIGAASTLSEDFGFGIFFGLYVLSGTFGLALFHLKTESQRQRQSTGPRSSPFDGYYVGVLAGISILIFASSLLIFFAFPRIGLGLFAESARQPMSMTGFSDSVEVGDHGTVRDNPSVVMRVEFDGDRPADYASLRWRTMTFDHYDGTGWSRQLESDTTTPHSHSRSYDLNRIYTAQMRSHFDDDEAMTVQVYLEPLGSNVIPTLWPTNHVRLGSHDNPGLLGSRLPDLTFDGYGDLRHTLSNDVGLSYELTVQPGPDAEARRRQSGRSLNPDDHARYVQLPAIDSRIEQLALEWTEEAESNYEKAQAISGRFFESFEYTLDLPVIAGDDPIAEFLFEHRAGHCEYFAISAAVMLRSLDVPTRLVNGFLGGTWNEVGDYLTVRQGDAHAWIEIHVPELGWVPVEPTPPIESTFLERAGVTQLVSDTIDNLRHTWTIWFLEYDLQSQLRLFQSIGNAFTLDAGGGGDNASPEASSQQDDSTFSMRPFLLYGGWLILVLTTLWRGRRHPDVESWRYGAGVAGAATAGAIWVGLFQAWNPFWWSAAGLSVAAAGAIPAVLRRHLTPPSHRLATRLFDRIERQASRRAHGRHPDEGPGDFLRRLAERLPDARRDLEIFRTLYLDLRFGNRDLDDRTQRKLKKCATAAIRALKSSL